MRINFLHGHRNALTKSLYCKSNSNIVENVYYRTTGFMIGCILSLSFGTQSITVLSKCACISVFSRSDCHLDSTILKQKRHSKLRLVMIIVIHTNDGQRFSWQVWTMATYSEKLSILKSGSFHIHHLLGISNILSASTELAASQSHDLISQISVTITMESTFTTSSLDHLFICSFSR